MHTLIEYFLDMFYYLGIYKISISILVISMKLYIMWSLWRKQKNQTFLFNRLFFRQWLWVQVIVLIALSLNITLYVIAYVFEKQILEAHYDTKLVQKGFFELKIPLPELREDLNDGETIQFFNLLYLVSGILVYLIGGIADAYFQNAYAVLPDIFFKLFSRVGFFG